MGRLFRLRFRVLIRGWLWICRWDALDVEMRIGMRYDSYEGVTIYISPILREFMNC